MSLIPSVELDLELDAKVSRASVARDALSARNEALLARIQCGAFASSIAIANS